MSFSMRVSAAELSAPLARVSRWAICVRERLRAPGVGDGLVGSTFWIVSEHGARSAYVRNIEADPRVRVRVRGRWRSGTAHLMPDDDPRDRQRALSERRPLARLNAAAVRGWGTDLLTVRIDLDG
jgi:deazaflavin-dependent oxidoreductase (nitroreductase family)